jgi:hypothetical protein
MKNMPINSSDTSNYFKGMLILISRKKQITHKERTLLMDIAHLLGFNKAYIDSAIDDFMNNKNIKTEIPLFSNWEVAELFLKDGIKLAFTDKTLTVEQIEWLMAVAIKNTLSKQWFFIELENYLDNYEFNYNTEFELQKHMYRTYKKRAYAY